MIIYESLLEKTPLVRKLLGGAKAPRAPPLPTALLIVEFLNISLIFTRNVS